MLILDQVRGFLVDRDTTDFLALAFQVGYEHPLIGCLALGSARQHADGSDFLGLDAAIARVATRGVNEPDLRRAKTRLLAEAVYAQDNQATLAHWYGASLAAGLSLADVAQWPERIDAVTPDGVKKAALWLDKRRSVTSFLLPAESYTASTGTDTIHSLAL